MDKFNRLETASVLSIATLFTAIALGIFVGPVQGAAPAAPEAATETTTVETTTNGEGRFKLVVTARRLDASRP